MATTKTAKDEMLELLAMQPDDSTYDELLRELAFARMVDRGLTDSDADRVITSADLRTRASEWQK